VGGLCLGDSILIEVSLEYTGEDSSEEWSNDVGSLVHQLSLWSIWIDSSVHHFLENWLNDTDGWVEASSGNTSSSLDAGVESDTDGEGVEWNILGTVMLDDLDDKSNEQEGHHELNEHGLSHKFSTIVATVGWAELGKVVSSSSWKLVTFLSTKWESHEADGASEHSTEDLSDDDKDTVE